MRASTGAPRPFDRPFLQDGLDGMRDKRIWSEPVAVNRKRSKTNFLDVRTSFFRPLWKRVLVTGVCLTWAAFELATGSIFWAILFGAAGASIAWQFFVTFDDRPDDSPDDSPGDGKDEG